jgi:hypothetical protein
MVLEMSVSFICLTRLIAREDFIESRQQAIMESITFRKCNKYSPVLQQMLKTFPSLLNGLSILAEHVDVNSLEFFPRNF